MSTIARLRSLLAKRDAADPNSAEWIDAATDFVNARVEALPALLECVELLSDAAIYLRTASDETGWNKYDKVADRIDRALAALEKT